MSRRRALARSASILVLALLASCGGGGGGGGSQSGGALAVAPPPPPVPPPPPPPFVGAVYAGTNNNGPGGNWVVGFGRRDDHSLVPLDAYDTGGVGRAAFAPPRLNSLVAEDSIIAVDDRFVIVVNAGTDDVTAFRINPDYSLTRTDIEASGGRSPVSLAYRDGIVYVANADADNIFTGPADQSGTITAMRLDGATGQLTRIGDLAVDLHGRPADLEVSPDGAWLIASVVNAGSALLPRPSAAEVSSFRIEADGRLAATPAGTGMSTQPGNPAGRNLPNAIGIETYARGSRQFLVAAETRTASPAGVPATSFKSLQTGSVSTWEIAGNGALIPVTQDFLLGPSVTLGPTQSGFIAIESGLQFGSVASSASGTITSLIFDEKGGVGFATSYYQLQGASADPNAANPLANADGPVDLAFSRRGDVMYQLVGLRGRVDVWGIVFSYEPRQQARTALLPMDNLQGLVVVGR